MSASPSKSMWRRAAKYCGLLLLALILLLGGFSWYVTTDSFQMMVKRRLIAQAQRITGGRVEVGSIHAIPFRFHVEVRGLVIHGKEGPGEAPLASIDSLSAEIKIISILESDYGFRSLVLEHPVFHLIVYPDGTTNQPTPAAATEAKPYIEQLFNVNINRLDLRRGELLWNDRKIPLDFSVSDVSADLTYSLFHRRYDGNLLLGKIVTNLRDYRPIAWMLEAHFQITPTAVEVHSLKAHSAKSHLEAGGRIDNFEDPRIEANYNIEVNVGEAGAVLRQPQARGGTFTASGTGSWSAKDFSSNGKLDLREVEWRNLSVNLSKASLSSSFALSPKRITLSKLDAHVLGGNVSGDAEVSNWMAPTTALRGKPAEKAQKEGFARLQFKDISTKDLFTTIIPDSRDREHINLEGVGDGSINIRWSGSVNRAQSQVDVAIHPPRVLSPGQLPLTATAKGNYSAQDDTLQISDLSAATRSSQVHASGEMGSNNLLKFSASTTDLNEWTELFRVLHIDPLPVRLEGRAVFVGSAGGKLSSPVISGSLAAQDFEYVIAATAQNPEQTIHWDSLSTDLQFSEHTFSAHHGSLEHGDTNIDFELSAQLHEGVFVPSSPFTARVKMSNADVHEVLELAGKDYPAEGRANLTLQALGTRSDPHISGQISLADGTIYGESIRLYHSHFQYQERELSLSEIVLEHENATVTGNASYSFGRHTIQADLEGKAFDLSTIQQIQSARFPITGSADFEAHMAGSAEEPSINGNVILRNLTLDGIPTGGFVLNAKTDAEQLHLDGHSQFQKAALTVDGTTDLHGDWPANIRAHFEKVDIEPLLAKYGQGRVAGTSMMMGDILLTGPLRHPHELQVVANIPSFNADVDRVKVQNDGPLRFAITHDVLQVQDFRLIGDGTDVSVKGSLDLLGDHSSNLQAQGKLNLQLIATLDPSFTSSGALSLDLAVSGPIAQPNMQGRLTVAGGSIAYIDLPSALSDINGSVTFSRNRAEIENLTAHTGGGLLTFHGFATSYNRQFNFDLGVEGREVRLRYPPGVSSTADLELRFAGSSTSSRLTGDVTVTRIGITPGFDFGASLERTVQSAGLPQTDPLLNSVKLDVHVSTTPDLQMQTAAIRLSGDADLNLRGTAGKPVLLGRVDIIEGQAYINGTKYTLERGDITFTSPVTTTPVLDLQASTRVRDYDITLNLNGEVDKLNITYRAEPPLPTADIVGLLAFGQTTEESAQLQQNNNSVLGNGASGALLSEALNATLGTRAQRLFGVSRIKIDPQGLETETSLANTGPAITIEQQVKDNLTVTYSTEISQTSQQLIQVEYNLTRNVSIVAVRDQNGVVSFQAKVRRQKK